MYSLRFQVWQSVPKGHHRDFVTDFYMCNYNTQIGRYTFKKTINRIQFYFCLNHSYPFSDVLIILVFWTVIGKEKFILYTTSITATLSVRFIYNVLNDLVSTVTHYHPTEDKRTPHADLLLSSDSQPSSPFPLTSRRSFVLLAFVSPTYLISNSQTSAKCLYSSCIQITYHTTKIKTFLFDVKQCTL